MKPLLTFTHLTENPPESTDSERCQFVFGRAGMQYARQHKLTKVVEYWWTGNDGKWAAWPDHGHPFVPTIEHNSGG